MVIQDLRRVSPRLTPTRRYPLVVGAGLRPDRHYVTQGLGWVSPPDSICFISRLHTGHRRRYESVRDAARSRQRSTPTIRHPLSEIVRTFKSYSAHKINEYRHLPGTPVWQRGYYEHVIRSEEEFTQIGEYILFNAAKWETDRENPHTLIKASALPFEY